VHSSSRPLPFILLAVFGVLVIGAIALSLTTAPPLAQQQLQRAAKTTMAAPSFVLVITDSVSNQPGSSAQNTQPPGTQTLHVVYQAPDSVQETELGPGGQSASVIVIGDRRFRSSDGTWTELPPSPGLGTLAVASIMTPLQAAANATDVTRQGDLYTFGATNVDALVSNLLAVGTAPVSSASLTAVVSGDYVTHQTVTAVVGGQRLTLDLAFSDFGTAPAIEVPPHAQTQAPASGAPATP
jgi:uncharacterized protein YejL (UPF0352 family)